LRHPKDVVRILKIARRLEVGNLNDDFFSQQSAIFLLNIWKTSEEDILEIIGSFQQLKYQDSNIVRALESLFSTRLCQDADMVSTVCTYCTTMRIRLPPMLNTVSYYFTMHYKELTVPQVTAMAEVFGELNYQPVNGDQFWSCMEEILAKLFPQFQPSQFIHLLLTFAFIDHLPIHLINKIFSPFFLDRLHTQTPEVITESLENLKVLEAVMYLKDLQYDGPFLPLNQEKREISSETSFMSESIDILKECLEEVLERECMILTNNHLSDYFNHPVFRVDLLIHPHSETEDLVVLLMNSENYDCSGTFLLGRQAMKVRHIQSKDYKVICINVDILEQPQELRKYMLNLIKDSL